MCDSKFSELLELGGSSRTYASRVSPSTATHEIPVGGGEPARASVRARSTAKPVDRQFRCDEAAERTHAREMHLERKRQGHVADRSLRRFRFASIGCRRSDLNLVE